MELRDWQNINRWNNTALAKKLGVTQATISRVAIKAGKPSLLLAKTIERFTKGKVTLEDLGVEEK